MIPNNRHSDRLTFTALQQKDAVAAYQIWSDPLVTKFMNIEPFKEITQAEAMIAFFEASLQRNEAVRYGVFYQGQMIGSCGFNEINWETGTTEIGYELAQTCFRQGFGTEMLKTLSEIAFNQLQLKEIIAEVEQENRASQQLLLKQGFKLISASEKQLTVYQKLKAE
ncbi:GNAT family N-acetyltransferase [Isobaculum melis]|uniref:Ribosomal-protein-alanine N-acetyltransferase n=1 Tax=Isobaculum melis TaxID=142588 RepID=A0A1H9ST37_9LACT|nr:GNAT family N-acetyltransferase [Isobaculum melis]SER88126.1 ribosomal-protein-alanine N-acetyltransferase [Isobaculum melis]